MVCSGGTLLLDLQAWLRFTVCGVCGFCGGLTGGFTGGVSCGSFQAGRHGYHAAEKVANATGNPLEKMLTQGYDDGHKTL